ncbi:amino acid adenylation domain-containing protein [Mesorhizobium sp. 1B3]|uniref:amino acid adenylation domain-containing protein n=1 Tax=Mesorhizobium sp. 1B3 TaxID=3243599 RepID=UPI003D962FDD
MIRQLLPDPTTTLTFTGSSLIFDSFLHQANASPNATALVYRNEHCSYGALEQISRGVANALLARHIRSHDRILIVSDRSPALVFAILGAARAGVPFSVVDAAYPKARIASVGDILEPSVVLICGGIPVDAATYLPKSCVEKCATLRISERPRATLEAFSLSDGQNKSADLDPNRPAYIVFTSGSTGQPKGVVTGHAPLCHFVDWHAHEHHLSRDDRFSLLSGLSHDPIFRDIFTPLSIGASLHIPDQNTISDAPQLTNWFLKEQISVAHLTPAMGEIIIMGAEGKSLRFSALRYLFWGGDVLTQRTYSGLYKIAPDAKQINFYGTTETPQAMAHFEVPSQSSGIRKYPIGHGIADVQVLVMRDTGTLAEVGELGEVWIRTPYLSRGYINDKDETQAKFIINPFTNAARDICYRTGDLGRYLPDGDVEFVGRADDQVKIRGFRVDPAEVSAALASISGIKQAAVSARDDALGTRQLVGYFTRERDSDISSRQVRELLEQVLPSYMVPASIIRLENFPLLPNGKIDRLKLTNLEEAPEQSDYIAPADDIERTLAKIWQDALGLERVGVTESFLALGGDSLSAMQALIRMRKHGISTEVARGIFQGRTIRQIAQNDLIASQSELSSDAKRNLNLNIVRGVLLALNVANHWMPGFLMRFPLKAPFLEHALAVLFNVATPGFAFVFGVTLGNIYYPKYRTSPGKTIKLLLTGTWMLVAGIVIMVAGAAASDREHLTLWSLYAGGVGPLQYYAIALATAPIWFLIISASRSEYLSCIGLMVLFYFLFKLAEGVNDSDAPEIFNLLLVEKFSYFNMSVGALAGILAGIYLRRHFNENMAAKSLIVGIVSMLAGLLILYTRSGTLQSMYGNGGDMGMWRWTFYIGTVFVLASGVSVLVRRLTELSTSARVCLQAVAAFGQCTLPIFVLHLLVLNLKDVLEASGIPELLAMCVVLGIFFTISVWVVSQVYQLCYGPAGSFSEGVVVQQPA